MGEGKGLGSTKIKKKQGLEEVDVMEEDTVKKAKTGVESNETVKSSNDAGLANQSCEQKSN